MAFKLIDRVCEISLTTGTGAMTLGGAVTGCQPFSAAFASGDTTWYVAEGGSQWEVGLGTFVSPAVLQRTKILASSAGGAAVDFLEGQKKVYVDLPASRILYGFAGAVAHFAMSSAPDGWLKANGALVSRTAYADLFAAIGTGFGTGDGSTTFALPDLRGEFIRGWDNGRGVDASRVFGSAQMGSHIVGDVSGGTSVSSIDNMSGSRMSLGFDPPQISSYPYERFISGASANATGANHWSSVRPRNIALLACIKY